MLTTCQLVSAVGWMKISNMECIQVSEREVERTSKQPEDVSAGKLNIP